MFNRILNTTLISPNMEHVYADWEIELQDSLWELALVTKLAKSFKERFWNLSSVSVFSLTLNILFKKF